MKVVLFHADWLSVFSTLISIVTLSRYTHAGILVGDVIYDASESRGNAGIAGPLKNWGKRKISVFHVDDPDLYGLAWAKSKTGSKYDWTGVFGWIFGEQKRRCLYCFEYVMGCLFAIERTDLPAFKRLSGNDVLKKIGKDPIYQGQAKDWDKSPLLKEQA